jgi:hypothetical protein
MEQIMDNRLEQVTFLHALAKDFDHFHHMYLKAFPILVKYNKIPRKMESEEEWGRVADALSEYYQGVRLLYRIALLAESGVIDEELLCICYYDEITGNLTLKLNTLMRWCGTGLDLAANYNSYELARTVTSLINLLEKLDTIHQKHGADLSVEGCSAIIERFKEETKEFLTSPEKFSVDSPDNLDRYVTVIKTKNNKLSAN